MVLFANYKTIVVNVDGKGAAKGKNKVQGGKRVMYTAHHSCWDAKNRFGLPEEAEFSYEVVRGVIEGGTTSSGGTEKTTSSVTADAVPPSPKGEGKENPSALARAVERAAAEKGTTSPDPAKAGPPSPEPQAAPAGEGKATTNAANDAQFTGLPDALVRMMQEAGVTPNEVRYVIAQKGIYPANTPWAVIVENQQFMQGWLMHPQVWPKVVEMAVSSRDEVPF